MPNRSIDESGRPINRGPAESDDDVESPREVAQRLMNNPETAADRSKKMVQAEVDKQLRAAGITNINHHQGIAPGTGVPPGRYYIRTCEHGPGGQPAGWGLAAWKDLANRDGSSAWVHVHSNDEWASQWDIQPGKTAGSYRIKFYSGKGGNAEGFGLAAWNGVGDAKRNDCSTWVAAHDNEHWMCDWTISPHLLSDGKVLTWEIKTCEHGPGGQPGGWGLSAWHNIDSSKRDGSSTRVAVHTGEEWPCKWTLERC